MNEAETRAEYIDPALAAAGWGVVEGSRIRREYPITLGRIEGQGRRGKPLTADYVLVYRNTLLPDAGRIPEPHLCRDKPLARPLCRRPFRGQGGLLPEPLLPFYCH